MTLRFFVRTSFLPLALAVLAAACGGDDSGPSPTGSAEPSTSATEQATANPGGPAEFVAVFASPEGTHAALAALAARTDVPIVLLSGASRDATSFADVAVPDRMQVIGTTLRSTARESEAFDAVYLDFTGEDATDTARQAYDSVYIAALGAMGVNATPGEVLTNASVFVANPPGEVVGPGDFEHVKELVLDGQEINYTGISGFVDLTAASEVSKGSVEVWRLVGGEAVPIENRDVDAAAEVGAEIPGGSLVRSAAPQEAPLVLGVISETDADTGDPTEPAGVGAMIAVNEINAAGGVFGQPLGTVFEAPGQGAAQSLLDAGANVIIGPTDAASAEQAATVASAVGVPVFAFVTAPDASGGFFDMAPPDTLQGPVLANLALEQGKFVACVLYESGTGDALAAAFGSALEHKQGRVREGTAFVVGDDLGEIVNKCVSG